jgi:hypothetical protein
MLYALAPPCLSTTVRPLDHAMKSLIAFILGLAVGAAITWLVAYAHPRREADRRGLAYIDRVEPEFVGTAIYALSTIPLIESGDTNAAIERLSHPIATYYRLYAHSPGTNEYRAKMRDTIDKFARSNAVVAASIEREMRREHE